MIQIDDHLFADSMEHLLYSMICPAPYLPPVWDILDLHSLLVYCSKSFCFSPIIYFFPLLPLPHPPPAVAYLEIIPDLRPNS